MRIILHIDFNSYFASVEQQANPRLRGKPIGVTGGDRMERTVIGAASLEAKKFGVKTGMQIWEARKLCPDLILVQGDSDKYLATTKKFLNILKAYSPKLEVFSIDEAFLELVSGSALEIVLEIKSRIRAEFGEWVRASVGISYNKVMAKLASSLYKPDGLVVIEDPLAAQLILDNLPLDCICGIGSRIKKRLNNMGIFSFKTLRKIPLEALLISFKSYGYFLYNISRGLDYSEVVPFYEKAEIKSVGHRHTLSQDTDNQEIIKQILLKLTELIARRLRVKKLLGKTVFCWFRYGDFSSEGIQSTILPTNDGLDIFKASWRVFHQIWNGEKIRMIGSSISNLQSEIPANLSLLEAQNKTHRIIKTLDQINDHFGEFTLKRGILINSANVYRKPNPYLSDRRFKL